MEIKRINTYEDDRFSKKALLQHGCFLVDGAPYEVEIISKTEAVIKGADKAFFPAVIDEFRFFTPHITCFYDDAGNTVKAFPIKKLIKISLEKIQPSQFYIDKDKIAAIKSFIHEPDDIVIQVIPYGKGFISLDGHTRLYYAVIMGWNYVYAVEEECDDWVYRFTDEAQRRSIFTPKDMALVSHEEYEEKWNRFCDDFFANAEE